MDSCGWTRMGNEDGEGLTGADAAASWQQCYTWCTPYSHPHPHHHPHHPRQYQGNQYQQLPGSTSAATNASTHYPSSQQHHLQLQNAQPPPPPLDQQQHLHPVRGQSGLRRTVPYDGSGIHSRTSSLTISIYFVIKKNEVISCELIRGAQRFTNIYTSDKRVNYSLVTRHRFDMEVDYISTEIFFRSSLLLLGIPNHPFSPGRISRSRNYVSTPVDRHAISITKWIDLIKRINIPQRFRVSLLHAHILNVISTIIPA